MPAGRSLGGHGSNPTPVNAGKTPSHSNKTNVQAGGADYDGVVEEETEPVKRAGRPKVKKENLPQHVI